MLPNFHLQDNRNVSSWPNLKKSGFDCITFAAEQEDVKRRVEGAKDVAKVVP